ncbi:maltose ABC transporter permease MalF [Haliangium ochraceum]|uniref:Maltose/maltodextrin transport system permease protein MalF n=1 Tax=Haliangium ochraceum (strain DSM 14365 / JCM 11303 / SMP-2) TaxID=502025 RepID=D0LWJ2_HALO1|nr:maltose ABC transporter permease MalF [Haliangium ochraceum]ACY17642.1 binding-protein-dependent transport systems inner membrane component [Haliangium ochraceum DSM 14365]
MMRNALLKVGISAVVLAAALYAAFSLYMSGEPALAAVCLGAFALGVYVYTAARARTYRYLFPGLAGLAIFVLLPLVYTIALGFTRYRTENFLTFERATAALLGETFERPGDRYRVSLLSAEDGAYRLLLETVAQPAEAVEPGEPADAADEGDSIFGDEDEGDSIFGEEEEEDSIFADDADAEAGDEDSIFGEEEEDSIFADDEDSIFGEEEEDSIFADDEDGDAAADDDAGEDSQGARGAFFVSEPVALDELVGEDVGEDPAVLRAVPLSELPAVTPEDALSRIELIKRRDALQRVSVRFPDDSWAVKDKLSIDLFLPQTALYTQNPDQTLVNNRTGEVLTPNFDTGFYENAAGEFVRPGFRVLVGFDNYMRLLTDRRIQEPFLRIFLWTVLFAGFTVLFTLIVGLVLAELMSWEALPMRGLYQILLFLPYAVPGFISILVFKGLFNSASGEINQILLDLFGVAPDWFGDPFLAKVMILIVNTWLGYPYIMLLCMGLKKSVPSDLYEATALAGASPLTNFLKITWPLIRKPLTPLLIASFAFNFNNFVLVFLLTGGRPDFLNTSTPAGETDILVSYTYRIAFQDSGQNYGLAGAISTLIFVLVAILSIVNLRMTNVNKEERR